MKGILRLKEDKTWVVEYKVWDDERTFELPLLPESALIVRIKPDLEVEFKESPKEEKVYAKLMPKQSKEEFDVKSRVKNLMRNNIKSRLGKDCEFCNEHIDDWNKPICDGCLEALKELVLERKNKSKEK